MRHGISDGTFTDCQLICQQILRRQSGNLLAEMGGISACRFTDSQFICQQIWRESVKLPAELEETVRKSVNQNRRCISADRFMTVSYSASTFGGDSYEFCQP